MINALRDATNDIHLKLHEHPALKDLLSDTITYDYYYDVLIKFYQFHATIEEAILNGDQAELYLQHRTPTLDLLRHDIETIPHTETEKEKKPNVNIDVSEPEAVWAYLYVKEGSLLGGTVIYKALQRNLDDFPTSHKYFKGLGNDTAAHWHEFVRLLEHNAVLLRKDRIIKNALEIFNTLYDWMSRP